MKMKTGQRHQKRLIRAVYPNGSETRGYHIILSIQNAKPLPVPRWLTNLAGNVTAQTFASY
jgi:hypothetical protein